MILLGVKNLKKCGRGITLIIITKLIDFIKKYKDRIYSIHLKDKTGPNTKPANANQVWGQGETPLKDVLTLLKQEKLPLYCDIELEYETKPWSNAVKELGVCVRHAREILL